MSDKAQPTPGPWTFDNRSMTGAVWADKAFVASVYPNAPDDWDGFGDYAGLEEMRANARLIAAAPDLLEALLLILPLAKGYRPEGQTDTARRTCNSWIEAAEEVVAKAIGETER